jgi:uncharacterized protein (DUF885 family)
MKGSLTAGIAMLGMMAARGDRPDKEALVATSPQVADALSAVVEEYFDRTLELNPLFATSIGDDRFDDRLANTVSPEFLRASEAMDREFLERVLAIDPEQLGEADRLTYDTFRWSREMDVAGYQFPGHLQPINQFYSMTNTFVQLGSGSSVHPFKTVKNYDDFLSRVDDFVIIVDQSIENMKVGMEQGIVQPTVLMENVLPQLESQITDDIEASDFYTPVENMPEDFSDADRARLTAAYRDAIANKIIPAYQRLDNFIGDDYLEATRETVGISELPNGEAWYAWLVRLRTTTELTPAEIHQIGLDEVARIHGEMLGVLEEVGFDGERRLYCGINSIGPGR